MYINKDCQMKSFHMYILLINFHNLPPKHVTFEKNLIHFFIGFGSFIAFASSADRLKLVFKGIFFSPRRQYFLSRFIKKVFINKNRSAQ